jgi:hypothetical protein
MLVGYILKPDSLSATRPDNYVLLTIIKDSI